MCTLLLSVSSDIVQERGNACTRVSNEVMGSPWSGVRDFGVKNKKVQSKREDSFMYIIYPKGKGTEGLLWTPDGQCKSVLRS